MMYQKGLGLLDLALCVDTQSGAGPTWEKARKMQQKMTKTRSHVEFRIIELTDILAPAQGEWKGKDDKPGRPPPPIASSSLTCTTKQAAPSRPPPPQSVSRLTRPPSYEEAVSEHNPSAPPPYTQSSTSAPYLNVQAELDEISDENFDLPKYESAA